MPPPASATRGRCRRSPSGWRARWDEPQAGDGNGTTGDLPRSAWSGASLHRYPWPWRLSPRDEHRAWDDKRRRWITTMSPEPEATLTPAERRARDAVRALPRPEADAAFRARLQREFVSGGIASPAREGAGARRPGRAETGRGPSRPWAGWAAPLSWAAAAVIGVACVLGLNVGGGLV